MMKIMKIISKGEFVEKVLYLFYGGLTTIINIVVYLVFTKFFKVDYLVSNVIAWIFAVLFAFVTNKLYVFNSKSKDLNVVIKEAVYFFGFRFLTLGLDMLTMFVMVQLMKTNDVFAKIVANVIVIISNYLASKFIIFRKR